MPGEPTNRVAKTMGGVTTNYLVDTLNPTGYAQVLDEVQSGTVTRNYAWGLQLVSQSQLTNATPPVSTWSTSYYGFDGHGSVRFLTDSTGAVTDTYDYDAFGNLINSTGSTPNYYLFAGEQYDPDISLYYNRARYLDVRVGRFWGMDTKDGDQDDPLSLHKYLYAEGNPVDGIDPSGHDDIGEMGIAMSMSVTLDVMPMLQKAGCLACSVQVPADTDIALLARLVFAEAIPTQTGSLAIASVVVNRTHSSRFPNSVSGVVYQSKQFDATFDGNTKWAKAATQEGIRSLRPDACVAYQYAVTAAQNALGGNTNTDAVLYYDDSIGEPSWATNGLLVQADVVGPGASGNYIDNPAGNGQYFFKYPPPKPKHGGNK